MSHWIHDSTEFTQATDSPGSALLLTLKLLQNRSPSWTLQANLFPVHRYNGTAYRHISVEASVYITLLFNTPILPPTTSFLNPEPKHIPQLHVQNTF
jgi:hypothetical protein